MSRNRTKYPAQVGYNDRQIQAGLTRVTVWVHTTNRQKLITEAKKLQRVSA